MNFIDFYLFKIYFFIKNKKQINLIYFYPTLYETPPLEPEATIAVITSPLENIIG